MWMTSHGQCPRGCVLVNVQEWGCFSIFRRADDVTRTMSKGGGACECPTRVGACLWMSKSGGVFQFSGGRMMSRGQCPRGGGACECLHTPPPSGNPVFAPGVPPIQVQPPPPPGWLTTGLNNDVSKERLRSTVMETGKYRPQRLYFSSILCLVLSNWCSYAFQLCLSVMPFSYAFQLCLSVMPFSYAFQLCLAVMPFSYAFQLCLSMPIKYVLLLH